MIRTVHRLAVAAALLALATAPALAAPPSEELPVVPAAEGEAVAPDVAPEACAPAPDVDPLTDALPTSHGEVVRCNEECQSYFDDCSHICGHSNGNCINIGFPACFTCFC